MATQFGVSEIGFKPMSLVEVRADLEAALQASFGTNINLSSESVFGQLVAILSERHALLWQLAQAEYNALNPVSATGLAVDNILALNNLRRLGARATVTAPQPAQTSQGVTLYGLVLYGTPGTVIPAGALVSDGKDIATMLSLDAAITIGAPSNARQSLVFSNAPTDGAFKLTLYDALGNAMTTGPLLPGLSASDLQTSCQNLQRKTDNLKPFSDLAVTSTSSGFQFDFGALTPADGQPASGAAAIPLVEVAQSSLRQSAAVTNLTVLESRVGAPAQGTGSATATVTGPREVLAGALTTIVTPQSGWSGVTNQLDCITGADVETDYDALARFNELRASLGSGSLASIVERVRQVKGVTATVGAQNLTNAAQQTLTFLGTANSGSYQLATSTGTTAPLAFDAPAGDLQAALVAIPGYERVRVTGTPTYGFTVDFNGSQGGQAQPLIAVVNNSTGVVLQPSFGRPPHSVEIVAAGGSDADVAAAILAALPAGMASYGSPVVNTLGTTVVGSTQLAVASAIEASVGLTINMPAVAMGTMIASISGNTITMTQPALDTVSGAPCILNHAPLLTDSAGNSQLVGFSRPVPTLIYVQIKIVSDQYVIPGQPTSGVNASSKWTPLSVATIQENILKIGNSISVGGLIVCRGTTGLVGSFNAVPGIYDYTLTFGTQPNPTNDDAIQLQQNEAPVFQASNVSVSFT